MIQYFPIVTGSLTVLGNINVSGSITTSGSITISGSITSASFASTASFVANAESASYVLTAQTASFVANAQTASYVLNAVSSSFASTASFVALAQSTSNAVSAATASFANNLTVAGTLTAQTIVVQTITSSVSFITGSTKFGLLSSNTHQFTGSIYTSGSMGINTNSPGQPLELYVADGNGIRLKNSGSADKRWDIVVSGNNFVINETGVTSRLYISSSGNIGMGTNTPGRSLDLSSGGDTYLRVTGNRGNSDDLHVGNVEFYNSNTTRIIAEVRAITGTGGTQSNSGQLTFYTNNAGTYEERMRITSGGRVGIGISGPAFLLDVGGGVNGVAQNVCRIGNAAGYTNGLIISKDASNYYTYNFGSGIQIGSQYSTTSGFVNETQTITALAASYFLLKSTGTSNGSSSTTFNLTGLPATDGTVIDVVLIVQKDATASGINTSGIFNINGTDPGISTVFASGTAAVTTIKTFRVGRFNGTWRIIGTVGSY